MSFTGFNRPCDHGKGGVSSIRLLPISNITGCTLNDSGSIKNISLRNGSSFADIQFVEYSASFRQSASGNYPLTSVLHEITFDIARNDAQSFNHLQMISDYGAEGFAALIQINSGEVFLVGWSQRFGSECPLLPTTLSSLSGTTPDDDPCCHISLRSQDTDFSLRFVGTV